MRTAHDSVSIAVASHVTGVEVHTLRFWETEFSEYLKPMRTDGGQRRYDHSAIQMIFLIKKLLRDEMFSLNGCKLHLKRLAGEKA